MSHEFSRDQLDTIEMIANEKMIGLTEYKSARNSWQLGLMTSEDFIRVTGPIKAKCLDSARALVAEKSKKAYDVRRWSEVFNAYLTFHITAETEGDANRLASEKMAAMEYNRQFQQGGNGLKLTPGEEAAKLTAEMEKMQKSMTRKFLAMQSKIEKMQAALDLKKAEK